MRRQAWIALLWLGMLLAAALVTAMSAGTQAASRASATTERFGPDGKSLNIALAKRRHGDTGCLQGQRIDDILAPLTSAIESIQPGAGGTIAPAAQPAHGAH